MYSLTPLVLYEIYSLYSHAFSFPNKFLNELAKLYSQKPRFFKKLELALILQVISCSILFLLPEVKYLCIYVIFSFSPAMHSDFIKTCQLCFLKILAFIKATEVKIYRLDYITRTSVCQRTKSTG